jgi:hypothetical protein
MIAPHEKQHNRSTKRLAGLKHALYRLSRPGLEAKEQAENKQLRRRGWAKVPAQVRPPREGVA